MTKSMVIGGHTFPMGERVYLMGILNITPDSFSDGGSFQTMDKALFHAKEMISEGADIIDVGGESTRPGHIQISEEEEIDRVAPVIEKIKKEFDIPVSIDTYKSRVARAALMAGADMVNDIWGLRYDEQMAPLVKEFDVPVCLMHNRNNTDYKDFMAEVLADLKICIELSKKAGISSEKLILDPGIGFGKTLEQNLICMNHLEELLSFELPVLLGTSRKSMIGLTLDLPVTEREEGTIATSVIGAMKGCHFVRVHNVEANRRAIRMTEAIRNETAG
jgi:dihydropteroate synthase